MRVGLIGAVSSGGRCIGMQSGVQLHAWSHENLGITEIMEVHSVSNAKVLCFCLFIGYCLGNLKSEPDGKFYITYDWRALFSYKPKEFCDVTAALLGALVSLLLWAWLFRVLSPEQHRELRSFS